MTKEPEYSYNVTEHPGYIGVFTRDTYPGALPAGTRIHKVNSEEGDGHPNGATGIVLGSVGHPKVGYGYFIEWDTRPKHAVFVMDFKVEAI